MVNFQGEVRMKTIKAISLAVAAVVAPNLQAGEIIDFASMADNGYSAPPASILAKKDFPASF
jgi:hypothetical protein